jgi:hypothetical protein
MKSAPIKFACMVMLLLITAPAKASASRVCVIQIAPADYNSRQVHSYHSRARPRHRRCYYPRYGYGQYHSVPPYGYYVRFRRYRR